MAPRSRHSGVPAPMRASSVSTKYPTNADPEALFQYHADSIVAAAIAQTYHYMIIGGLEYRYLSTEESYILFKIDWARPHHLLFHLAEPRAEVEAHPENSLHCTAVSQVLAFTRLWAEDYEAILRRMPATERKQTPPPSAFEPRTGALWPRFGYWENAGEAPAVLDDHAHIAHAQFND
ncbi:hypothetical protein EDB81DRAFT_940048 [Dactylonectria macrodidyma]|uniref:Uncharacterized protein n=1 Tax=Dactylonectria macrodidyma TaxID=307937 RepID=A0A9P9FSS3_9HYPO|nr:hypothetical protein EDB81DRAFT_940048 [Dactylonectria macrodidyma]